LQSVDFGVWAYPQLGQRGLILMMCPKCGTIGLRRALVHASLSKLAASKTHREGTDPGPARHRVRCPAIDNCGYSVRCGVRCEVQVPIHGPREWKRYGQSEVLAVVRDPFRRLVSGYAELHKRWTNLRRSAKFGGEMRAALARASFTRLAEPRERARAFVADFVMGRLYTPARDARCLNMVREGFHLAPMWHGFFRSFGFDARYVVAHRALRIEDVAAAWAPMLARWGVVNASSSLRGIMGTRLNTHAASAQEAAMREVLNGTALRAVVRALYAQDFQCLGLSLG
jgi:hypothetical protein